MIEKIANHQHLSSTTLAIEKGDENLPSGKIHQSFRQLFHLERVERR